MITGFEPAVIGAILSGLTGFIEFLINIRDKATRAWDQFKKLVDEIPSRREFIEKLRSIYVATQSTSESIRSLIFELHTAIDDALVACNDAEEFANAIQRSNFSKFKALWNASGLDNHISKMQHHRDTLNEKTNVIIWKATIETADERLREEKRRRRARVVGLPHLYRRYNTEEEVYIEEATQREEAGKKRSWNTGLATFGIAATGFALFGPVGSLVAVQTFRV
ncbi:hypothetical protein BGZ60DRAFT_425282 [Tricladium varicosporioides]|nr:hypothetical protein BGZ60DRAFT_425282 [Hymenoscyphus varicosporioides]